MFVIKKLLDSAFEPSLRLLQYLYKYNSYQTITFFSESLELDRRTLLKTIRILQKDISLNNWQDLITLEVIDKNLSATFGPLFSIETFYSYYMSKSFSVNLALRLFTHQSDNIDDLADYLYVSKATFYRKILPLKQVLADFDLILDFTSSENKLIGSEKQIRHFFFTFFWETFRSFPYSKSVFSNEQKNAITDFCTKNELTLSFSLIIELHLEIALNHFNRGYVMNSFPPYKLPELYFSYSDFNELVSPYFSSDSDSSSFIENEISAVYFSITTSTLFMQNENYSLSLRPKCWSSSILSNVHEWIDEFVKFFKISLPHDDYVYLTVNLYLLQVQKKVLVGGSSSIGFDSIEDVVYNINHYVYDELTLFFDFIAQKKNEFHVDEFQKFSYVLLLRRIIFNSLPELQVLVCSKFGIEEQNWLENCIANRSTVPTNFHTTWSPNLDLIISDFQLPQHFIPENPEAYFLGLPFSGFSEWYRLVTRLEKIYFSKL
ncbi:helix-turn-helix domain-containing protein [Carnobacterium maltaromaticum]|uniref:helix-turn-helix domain-containing protein n=1 Tax=Carnobacterium maltaromaticum TaxID=2751 RepID=UPI002ADE1D9E|nr:helix-turn-helix domain-containing protein [Carnobacterium maltaromaticum]